MTIKSPHSTTNRYSLRVDYYGFRLHLETNPPVISSYLMFSGVKSKKVALLYLKTIKEDDDRFYAYFRKYTLIHI